MTPNESVIAIHVHATRRPKTIGCAEEERKEEDVGQAELGGGVLAGMGKPMDRTLKTSGCSSTMCFVGPRSTEKMSTGTIRSATRSTQVAASKKARNHQPARATATSS